MGRGVQEMGVTDLLLLVGLSTALSAGSLLGLALLEKGLGDEDLVRDGNGTGQVSIVCPQEARLEQSAERKNCSYSATFSTEG